MVVRGVGVKTAIIMRACPLPSVIGGDGLLGRILHHKSPTQASVHDSTRPRVCVCARVCVCVVSEAKSLPNEPLFVAVVLFSFVLI